MGFSKEDNQNHLKSIQNAREKFNNPIEKKESCYKGFPIGISHGKDCKRKTTNYPGSYSSDAYEILIFLPEPNIVNIICSECKYVTCIRIGE